jgi:hypothetical protein
LAALYSGAIYRNSDNRVVAVGQGIGARPRLGIAVDGHGISDRRKYGRRRDGANVGRSITIRISCGNVKANRVGTHGGVRIEDRLTKSAHPAVVGVSNGERGAADVFGEQDDHPSRQNQQPRGSRGKILPNKNRDLQA